MRFVSVVMRRCAAVLACDYWPAHLWVRGGVSYELTRLSSMLLLFLFFCQIHGDAVWGAGSVVPDSDGALVPVRAGDAWLARTRACVRVVGGVSGWPL